MAITYLQNTENLAELFAMLRWFFMISMFIRNVTLYAFLTLNTILNKHSFAIVGKVQKTNLKRQPSKSLGMSWNKFRDDIMPRHLASSQL